MNLTCNYRDVLHLVLPLSLSFSRSCSLNISVSEKREKRKRRSSRDCKSSTFQACTPTNKASLMAFRNALGSAKNPILTSPDIILCTVQSSQVGYMAIEGVKTSELL